jgi:hypothetical protein
MYEHLTTRARDDGCILQNEAWLLQVAVDVPWPSPWSACASSSPRLVRRRSPLPLPPPHRPPPLPSRPLRTKPSPRRWRRKNLRRRPSLLAKRPREGRAASLADNWNMLELSLVWLDVLLSNIAEQHYSSKSSRIPWLNRKDQYVPARTSTYILINSCTSLYLLVPSCTVSHTTLYHCVPPYTTLYQLVHASTCQYMPGHTNLGITYGSTYCLVPIWGFLYGLVSTSIRTGSYQYIPSCTTLYQGYRVPDVWWHWISIWGRRRRKPDNAVQVSHGWRRRTPRSQSKG